MACAILSDSEVTKKIDPLPRPNHHARLVAKLSAAIEDAEEIDGQDIKDVLLKLIASARRRELEALPLVAAEREAA